MTNWKLTTTMLRENKDWKSSVKAFTLLESLLVLTIIISLTILLSSQVKPVFSKVRQQLFFLEFEHLYRETQELSQAQGQRLTLQLSHGAITNGYQTVTLPEDITGPNQTVVFETHGGNNSLQKLSFQTPTQSVHYQLYIGSGKYKKTAD
ncbi:competence type IV pilus minor pilin ComGD [Streptococcus moroccensis]|uniref:Competence protein ComGD n=1 Tax=Streptococcus moroccensis TaxID=1451356 RepID=A0ABT9YSS1_9STRE|nr:competence type IV pilus minor pilin ComGD [Streptococcus moroccensis]MDQ0222932.1 competence protein ComGD [Streptococcus moroccensis]